MITEGEKVKLMYKAKIRVTLKKSVLDPQGKTVLQALQSLGFDQAKDLRVGKFFELAVAAPDKKEAEERARAMCDKLLVNPVMEEYSVEIRDEREETRE